MKYIIFVERVICLVLLFSFSSAIIAQEKSNKLPFIKVEGKNFIDEEGNVFVFRGVSFPDPDRLEKAGQWNKRYFEGAKDWNCNVVRFAIHPQAWRERGQKKYLQLLDDGIKWAGELGMYVIIDWHSMGNLKQELYQDPMYFTTKTETFNFWKTIAERYKGNSTVAFYELFNEPTRGDGRFGRISWGEFKGLMEDIIYIIYAYDKNVIPLVAGFNWAYHLTEIREQPIDFPGIAYVTHPYPQKRNPPWEEKWELDWGFIADTYPIVATEFGFMSADERGAHRPVISDEVYGEAIIDYFEKKGISWTAWVFDPLWSPMLIKNWDFEPTRQGKLFKEKLLQLNQKK